MYTEQKEYLKGIFKKVAEKHNVSEKKVDEIYNHFFSSLKSLLQTPMLPEVRITKFGTFKPSLVKVNRHIRKKFSQYNQGNISREELAETISLLWVQRQMLIKEKNYRQKNDNRYGRCRKSKITD